MYPGNNPVSALGVGGPILRYAGSYSLLGFMNIIYSKTGSALLVQEHYTIIFYDRFCHTECDRELANSLSIGPDL